MSLDIEATKDSWEKIKQGANDKAKSIKPLGDRVLVRIDDAASQTAAGLIIPDDARGKEDRHFRGEVLAVGPKVNEVEVGQIVTVPNNYAGDEVLEANGRRPLLILVSIERIGAIVLPPSIQPPTSLLVQ